MLISSTWYSSANYNLIGLLVSLLYNNTGGPFTGTSQFATSVAPSLAAEDLLRKRNSFFFLSSILARTCALWKRVTHGLFPWQQRPSCHLKFWTMNRPMTLLVGTQERPLLCGDSEGRAPRRFKCPESWGWDQRNCPCPSQSPLLTLMALEDAERRNTIKGSGEALGRCLPAHHLYKNNT